MIKSLFEALLLATLIIFCVLTVPTIHYNILRHYVSDRVVMITNANDDGKIQGQATGSHIRLPSGKTAILTNAHVCELKDEHNEVNIISPLYDRPIRRRVIEVANFTDLCLIEPLENISGLRIGSEPSLGDVISVLGHPVGMPQTISKGEVVGKAEVEVLDHEMEPDDTTSCNLPKEKTLTIPFFLGIVLKVCVVHVQAYQTNMLIFPGNSGSPAFNWRGQLVGVAFASSNQTHYGDLITIDDVKKFIAAY